MSRKCECECKHEYRFESECHTICYMNMCVRCVAVDWVGRQVTTAGVPRAACRVPRAACACVWQTVTRQPASATKCIELWSTRSRVMGCEHTSQSARSTDRLDQLPCNRYLVLNECGARYAPGTRLLLHIEFTYVLRLHSCGNTLLIVAGYYGKACCRGRCNCKLLNT